MAVQRSTSKRNSPARKRPGKSPNAPTSGTARPNTETREKRRAPPGGMDEYLAELPAAMKAALESLRKVIKAAAPGAEEAISYQIPTFKLKGPLVAMAAFQGHCSFYTLSTAVMDAHKGELCAYETSKGTIRFKPDRPLPAALVRKLVKARIAENEKSHKS